MSQAAQKDGKTNPGFQTSAGSSAISETYFLQLCPKCIHEKEKKKLRIPCPRYEAAAFFSCENWRAKNMEECISESAHNPYNSGITDQFLPNVYKQEIKELLFPTPVSQKQI